MTELRFSYTPGIIPKPLLEKAYFADWGRLPRPTQIVLNGDEMIVRAPTKGSGTLHVLWPHRQLGLTLESTDSLIGQAKPYSLMKELGRGALSRLLKRLFEWQMLGFRPPDELRAGISRASRRFSQAAVAATGDPEAEKELVAVLEEFDRLVLEAAEAFTEQSLAWRVRNNEKLPVLLGIGLNAHPIETLYEFDLYAHFLQDAFHAVVPMPTWRELEPEPGRFHWDALERRLTIPARFGFQVVMGPMLCFDTAAFPVWLPPRLREEGFFENRATRFVNAVAERYGSLAESWILASRCNSYFIPEIPTARALTLIRILAGQMRSRGIETPILVGINRPWGEYALEQIPEYEPVQVAESLIGCHDIDAFLMELHFGLDGRSTLPRDPMAVGAMLDQWGFLGKKIYVSFSVPSSGGSNSTGPGGELPPEIQWSEGLQQYWTESLLKTLLGKRMVQGIFWTPLQDAEESADDTKSLEPFTSSDSGLIDSHRVLKLAFKHFVAARQSILK